MSLRTVEYHLNKIVTKLAFSTRNQLPAAHAKKRIEGSPYRRVADVVEHAACGVHGCEQRSGIPTVSSKH
jgi:hypothetical protein